MPNLLCVVVAGRVRAAGDIQDVATAVHSPQSTSRRDQSAVTATPQLPHYHGVTSPHAYSHREQRVTLSHILLTENRVTISQTLSYREQRVTLSLERITQFLPSYNFAFRMNEHIYG